MEWVSEEEAPREDLKKMGWGASLTEHPRHRGTGGAKALRQNIHDAHEEQG